MFSGKTHRPLKINARIASIGDLADDIQVPVNKRFRLSGKAGFA